MSKLDPEMYNRMQEYMYSEEGQRNYEAQEKREQEEQKRREANNKAATLEQIEKLFLDVELCSNNIDSITNALKTLDSIQNSINHCRATVIDELIKTNVYEGITNIDLSSVNDCEKV